MEKLGMNTKRRKMLGLIVMISAIVASVATIVGTVAFFMEKQETSRINKNLHDVTAEKINANTNNVSEDVNQNIDDKFNLLMNKLGLDEKSEALLILLLGNDYRDILKDDEALNSLIKLLQEKTLVQILDENKTLKNRINSIEFIDNTETKALIMNLLSELKYESARKEIDKYIKETPDLNPKLLAQLFALKSQTYSGKDGRDYKKMKEFITKAIELDDKNPGLLLQYGKYLHHINQYDESIEELEKIIEYRSNGLHVSHLEMVGVYFTLATSYLKKEKKKPKSGRNYDITKEYLHSAFKEDSNLKIEDSRFHLIKRLFASIEMDNGSYERAIVLLNESLSFGFKNGLKNSFVTLNNTAFSYLYLGLSYRILYLKKGEEPMYNNSKNSFENALSIFNELYGNKSSNIAVCYQNLGSLTVIKDVDKAIDYFLSAKEIFESDEIQRPMELGGTYINLALSYSDKTNY